MKKITYSAVGDNYNVKDPVKKIAQEAARTTAKNLLTHGYREITESRGESAFVWEQKKSGNSGTPLYASVVEGLGTKNLVADGMRKITGRTYYDVIGHDTVATIINDLTTVGATPQVIHAYWATGDSSWFSDQTRFADFVRGWKTACDTAGVTWGGGETPTLKDIVVAGAIDLGGSASGIIYPRSRLLTDTNLVSGDRILLLKSNGVNANGLSLVRAVAKKHALGYAAKLPDGSLYGAAILRKTNIYARLLEQLAAARVRVHYIANITGHGLRKIMRSNREFTYIVEDTPEPQPVFAFIRRHAGLTLRDMYGTFNMGCDYALFLPKKDVDRAKLIISKSGFSAIDGGHLETGKRKVILEKPGITFDGDTLDLRKKQEQTIKIGC